MVGRTSMLLLLFLGVVGPGMAGPWELSGIRSGLERSPDDYVAGVIRFYGESQCQEHKGNRLCWVSAVVIDEIASRPTGRSPRRTIKFASAREPGRQATGKAIVFAVPIENTDIYSGALLMVYGPSKHRRFRELVEMAITGRRSI
jgi:hypothetical protein